MKSLLLFSMLFTLPLYALCPPSAPEPVRLTIAHQPHKAGLQLTVGISESGIQQLQLLSEQSGRSVASMDLFFANQAQQIQARPLLEDANLDGLTDHLWLLSKEGRLWRLPIRDGQFGLPKLMADLTASGLDFIATAGLLRARLPATLAPLAWRQADKQLVLLIARHRQSGHDTLFMLRFNMAMTQVALTQFEHLLDRTVLSEAEVNQTLSANDWRALLAEAGWLVQFPGKMSMAPTVIAGVIYAAVASTASPDACDVTDDSQQLFALHLHSATQVYRQRNKLIPYLADAQFALRQQADKQLKLVLSTETQWQVVLPNLLKISADCHNCTEPLSLSRFPLWKRLATYRSELGGY